MNEKRNRFIVSVARKNVLVFFVCFVFVVVVVVVVFFFFLRNTLGTHLSYLPWSLTADNDLEVNRNLNNKPNLFN